MINYHTRLRLLMAGTVVLFLVLAGRLFELQVSEHAKWEEIGQDKRTFTGLTSPVRAPMTTPDGKALALVSRSLNLSVVVSRLPLSEVVVGDVRAHLKFKGQERKAVRDDAVARIAASEPFISEIASITDRPPEAVAKAVYTALERVARKWQRPRDPQTIVHDLPYPVWIRLKQMQHDLADEIKAASLTGYARQKFLAEAEARKPFPGLRCTVGRRRVYPFGTMAAHAIGTLREYTREDIVSLRQGGRIVRAERYRQRYWDDLWGRLSLENQDRLTRFLDLPVDIEPGRTHHIAQVIGALKGLDADDLAQTAGLLGDPENRLAEWTASPDVVTLNDGERIWIDSGRYPNVMTVGASALEYQYNDRLRGSAGFRILMRLVARRSVEAAGPDSRGDDLEYLHNTQPRRGEPLRLTLDTRLQRVAEQALARYGARGLGLQRGAAILMDLRKTGGHQPGDILALASSPTFDPNDFIRPRSRGVATLLTDASQPLVNRAIAEQYPLGSVWKVFMSLVALEAGVTDPRRRIHCDSTFRLAPGSRRVWHCEHACGSLDLASAITHSCNVHFYRLAHELTYERILPWARRAGFGRTTGIDLPGEVAGTLPTPAWKKRIYGGRARRRTAEAERLEAEARALGDTGPARALRAQAAHLRKRAQAWQWESVWLPGDTVNIGIGQGTLAITPIQTARLMALIATGGELWTPRLVRSDRPVEPERILPFKRKHIRLVHRGMVGVTRDRGGTGYRLFDQGRDVGGTPFNIEFPDVRVAAKTGSAQTGRKHPGVRRPPTHSWLAGFAPADRPEVAFVVILEEAGFGAQAAGPAAVEILREYFRQKWKVEGGK